MELQERILLLCNLCQHDAITAQQITFGRERLIKSSTVPDSDVNVEASIDLTDGI